MKSSVFRKVALDRLASPEQLDQLMRVTSAKGWVALLGIGMLLATAIVWSVAGRIPEQVAGTGILVRSGGVYEVAPAAGGRVVDVAVSVGEMVSEGQVIARIAQDDLAGRLQQARATLEQRRAQQNDERQFGERDAALQLATLAQQREGLEQSLAAAERTVGWLEERVRSQEQLVEQGLLTRSILLATRQQLEGTLEKISQSSSELAQITTRQLTVRNTHAEQMREADARVADQARVLADLERQFATNSEVIAPQTGRILELMVERGGIVTPGEAILTLDLTGRTVKELEAVIYVPSVHGKRIIPGMLIQIAPSTVKQEEFGLMLGRVTYVSDYPATGKGMRRVLKNEILVGALAGGDAPYEVHADLIVDPDTPSRYRWTSSQGPPVRIQSGTLAEANIEVSARRPIEMVIPLLRKHTGI